MEMLSSPRSAQVSSPRFILPVHIYIATGHQCSCRSSTKVVSVSYSGPDSFVHITVWFYNSGVGSMLVSDFLGFYGNR